MLLFNSYRNKTNAAKRLSGFGIPWFFYTRKADLEIRPLYTCKR